MKLKESSIVQDEHKLLSPKAKPSANPSSRPSANAGLQQRETIASTKSKLAQRKLVADARKKGNNPSKSFDIGKPKQPSLLASQLQKS